MIRCAAASASRVQTGAHEWTSAWRRARFKVLDNGRLRLPKIGDLEVRWSRELSAAPTSVTVVRDAAGRHFASFVVQTADQPLPELDSEVGVDLGVTHFAVMSDAKTKRCRLRIARLASTWA